MISLQHLSLRVGSRLLFENASVTLHAGQKVGIIGRNGTGKTSLFRLLMGELSPDSGDLQIPDQLRKAWMKQETEGSSRSARDYVLDGHEHFRQAEAALASAEAANDDHAIATAHGELDTLEAWSLDNQAEQLLSGLGFSVEEFDKPVSDFSGGWRIRLNLAQALMCPSEILLLDEPTNHLDLEAALWLQQWLQSYPGTLLLISHDREFLDVLSTHILSLERLNLVLTRGNYSDWEKYKAERLAQQQAAYQKQQQRISEIDSFVRRFRAKASKARQAQSRLRELERMENIAPAHIDSPFVFRFRQPEKLPDSLLALDDLVIGYDKPVVSDINLNLKKDSRIALLGANGQGKSTLLKVLAGQLEPIGGKIHRHEYLKTGYLAQHHIDTLDLLATPMQMLTRIDPGIREQEGRNFLGGFDFSGDRINETVKHFSGGEKARLALSLLVWQKPNLLLLDEPTNHLDLEMRHALTLAMQEFEGAMILVSHDRHLLSNAVDEFLLVSSGRVEPFDGNLHDYESRLKVEAARDGQSSPAETAPLDEPRLDKKTLRQQAADHREKLKPLTKKLKLLETRLEKLGSRSEEIEAAMTSDDIYQPENQDRLQSLIQEKGEIEKETANLEEEWMLLSEEKEGLTAL